MTEFIEKIPLKFKTRTLIAIIIAIITATAYYITSQVTLASKVDTLVTVVAQNSKDIDSLQDKSSAKDIALAEINVKLANIETILSEVKLKLK